MVRIILIFGILAVVLIAIATARYFWQLLRAPARKPLILPKRISTAPPHPLRTRLLELCHGDSALVDRLFLSSKRPGKSSEWIYQKAIDDLIRDRSR